MKYISHRGNTNGPSLYENSPETILNALKKYDCEIDVHFIQRDFYLGHDSPDYKISLDFLLEHSEKLWIHCKNIEALSELIQYPQLNIFWHQEDNYTLTSHGWIWCYPNRQIIRPSKSIILMPEWNQYESIKQYPTCYGVCSDYVDLLSES
jgi:hypothetical protein